MGGKIAGTLHNLARREERMSDMFRECKRGPGTDARPAGAGGGDPSDSADSRTNGSEIVQGGRTPKHFLDVNGGSQGSKGCWAPPRKHVSAERWRVTGTGGTLSL